MSILEQIMCTEHRCFWSLFFEWKFKIRECMGSYW